MTVIKVCGITNVDDACAAAEFGADLLGVICTESPRRIAPADAAEIRRSVPAQVPLVGVFRDQPRDIVARIADQAGLDLIQLHGGESPEYCAQCPRPVIRRHGIPTAGTAALRRQIEAYPGATWHLLDPGAGSGKTFDWRIAIGLAGPIMLSGGLRPENVRAALATVRPAAVDVASGVESAPGRKDHARMRAFIEEVRTCDADANGN